MAKHPRSASYSWTCASVIVLYTISLACSGVNGVLDIGIIRPLTLMDGGRPAVVKRSDALWSTTTFRSLSKSIMRFLRRVYGSSSPDKKRCSSDKVLRTLGFLPRLLFGDQAYIEQTNEGLIQCRHLHGFLQSGSLNTSAQPCPHE